MADLLKFLEYITMALMPIVCSFGLSLLSDVSTLKANHDALSKELANQKVYSKEVKGDLKEDLTEVKQDVKEIKSSLNQLIQRAR